MMRVARALQSDASMTPLRNLSAWPGNAADATALTKLIASLEATVQDHYDDAMTLQSELP